MQWGGAFSASAQTPATPGVVIRERVEVTPALAPGPPGAGREASGQLYRVYIQGRQAVTRCVLDCTEPIAGSIEVTGSDSLGAPFATSFPISDLVDVANPAESSFFNYCATGSAGQLTYEGREPWVYAGVVSGDSVHISADGITPRFIDPYNETRGLVRFHATVHMRPDGWFENPDELPDVYRFASGWSYWWPAGCGASFPERAGAEVRLGVRVVPVRPAFEVVVVGGNMWPDEEPSVRVTRWAEGSSEPVPLDGTETLDLRLAGDAAPFLVLRRIDTGESGRELLGVPGSIVLGLGVVVAFEDDGSRRGRAAPEAQGRVGPGGRSADGAPSPTTASAPSGHPLARDYARTLAGAGAGPAWTTGPEAISNTVVEGIAFTVQVARSDSAQAKGEGEAEAYPIRVTLSLDEAGSPTPPAVSGQITARATVEVVHADLAAVQAFAQSIEAPDLALLFRIEDARDVATWEHVARPVVVAAPGQTVTDDPPHRYVRVGYPTLGPSRDVAFEFVPEPGGPPSSGAYLDVVDVRLVNAQGDLVPRSHLWSYRFQAGSSVGFGAPLVVTAEPDSVAAGGESVITVSSTGLDPSEPVTLTVSDPSLGRLRADVPALARGGGDPVSSLTVTYSVAAAGGVRFVADVEAPDEATTVSISAEAAGLSGQGAVVVLSGLLVDVDPDSIQVTERARVTVEGVSDPATPVTLSATTPHGRLIRVVGETTSDITGPLTISEIESSEIYFLADGTWPEEDAEVEIQAAVTGEDAATAALALVAPRIRYDLSVDSTAYVPRKDDDVTVTAHLENVPDDLREQIRFTLDTHSEFTFADGTTTERDVPLVSGSAEVHLRSTSWWGVAVLRGSVEAHAPEARLSKALRLPIDTDGDTMADIWELAPQNGGRLDLGGTPDDRDWDEDAGRSGAAPGAPGDGIRKEDEYRGALVDLSTHARLSPMDREIFLNLASSSEGPTILSGLAAVEVTPFSFSTGLKSFSSKDLAGRPKSRPLRIYHDSNAPNSGPNGQRGLLYRNGAVIHENVGPRLGYAGPQVVGDASYDAAFRT